MYSNKPELFIFFHLKIKEDKLPHLYGNFPLLFHDLIDLDNFIIKKTMYYTIVCYAIGSILVLKVFID